MELKAFVSAALSEIMEGVKEAQSKYETPAAGQINPPVRKSPSSGGSPPAPPGCILAEDMHLIQHVKFDVAVTAEKDTETKGGLAVIVKVFNVGGQHSRSSSDTREHRIQFDVPVSFPRQRP